MRHLQLFKRLYSIPVNLAYNVFNKDSRKHPLLILHGLFGSKQNWNSLSKQFAKRIDCPVYAIDLRNHGDSSKVNSHNYDVMSLDLQHFIQSNGLGLKPINLMGHSMGGKVAMHFALTNPQMVNRLCVVDMSPSKQSGSLTSVFPEYIDAMKSIPLDKIKNQAEADAILAKTIPEIDIRRFLLTNLKKQDSEYSFRINLDVLKDSLPDLWNFTITGQTDIPTLFIKGQKSKYIVKEKHGELLTKYFPNHELVEIMGAGHWVHAESPDQFADAVYHFFNE